MLQSARFNAHCLAFSEETSSKYCENIIKRTREQNMNETDPIFLFLKPLPKFCTSLEVVSFTQ